LGLKRERPVEQYLVREVKRRGARCDKYTTPGRRNVPDRILIAWAGRAAFCEAKAEGEVPTPAQVREHNRLRSRGFIVGVVDSKESVDLFLSILTRADFFHRPVRCAKR
jgi:hypothetical protein